MIHVPPSRDGYSTSELLRRGWTMSIVRKLLGAPDELARNPHYGSGAAMKLYRHVRVEAAERSPEFAKLTGKLRRNKGTP